MITRNHRQDLGYHKRQLCTINISQGMSAPIHFYPYTWHYREGLLTISAITPDDKTVIVQVDDFTPYVYLELPTHLDWDDELYRSGLMNAIGNLRREVKPLNMVFMKKKRLYYAHVFKRDKDSEYEYYKFPYLFVCFSSTDHLQSFVSAIRYGLYVVGEKLQLKVHESNADPVLQLVSCRRVPVAGWITAKKYQVLDNQYKLSYCLDLHISYADLEECTVNLPTPLPLVLSFDIEVNSSNINRMPKHTKPEDAIFQVSCVIAKTGDSEEKWTKILLSLKNPVAELVGNPVRNFKCEADLLEGFVDLVHEFNPQVLLGFNIFGFDLEYMMNRAQMLYVGDKFARMSPVYSSIAKKEEIKWASSAFNNNRYIFPDTIGRLFIDMLPVIRRDYTLASYSLKAVAERFLAGATKDPLAPKGIFKCYRIGSPESMSLVGKYAMQDSVVCLKLYEKLQTWIGLTEMANVCNVPIITLYTKGQQVKIFAQVYRYCLQENIVVERNGYVTPEGETYTGAIVFKPIPNLYDKVFPFDYNSLYPSVIIALNICYSTYVVDPKIPDSDCHVKEWEDHIGCEHDKEERKTKPKNIMCCKRRYRFLKKPKGVIPRLLEHLLGARKKTKKELAVTEDRRDDLLQLERTGDEKANVEERIRLDQQAMVYDKRQLALKVSANSMYGGMGVSKGMLPFMPGAMTCTAGGRECLLTARSILEKEGCNIVYGDTDSCMIQIPGYQNMSFQELWNAAKELEKKLAAIIPPPLRIEFEGAVYDQFFIMTKKKYCIKVRDKFGVVLPKMKTKGVMLARRDNSKAIRDVYQYIIDAVFTDKKAEDVVLELLDKLQKIYTYWHPLKDYIITKSVKDVDAYKKKLPSKDEAKRREQFYKKKLDPAFHTDEDFVERSLPAHVQLSLKMKKRGMLVEDGMRLSYIITTCGGFKAGVWEKIEHPEYYSAHADVLKLDFNSYVKLLVNPIDQVLEIRYGLKNWMKYHFKDRLFKAVQVAQIKRLFVPQVVLVEKTTIVLED
jgi:DNA polymerase elongation subunit (family B)